MNKIIKNKVFKKNLWLEQLSNSIVDPINLLKYLNLDKNIYLRNGTLAKKLFPFRIPKIFAKRISKNNPNDPILLQILPLKKEFKKYNNFVKDPLKEHDSILPNLLHKYKNRVLLIVKNGCAINCRYCFRRHFPYFKHKNFKKNLKKIIEYISKHNEINEVILSGGDPLMAKDYELNYLINLIEKIKHINILRIHSRLPVIIPSRINSSLCKILFKSRLNIVLVTHINHFQEIGNEFKKKMFYLKKINVTILNQSVLLYGINDNYKILSSLSKKLFYSGVIPYYLHILDPVKGASHFQVNVNNINKIFKKLLENNSGYLVPKIVYEISGKKSKIPINLNYF
ncbi:EF-P beta-lysylation protein EpmB [Sodalis-like secondary symbiont of Drepanosiphum platanoidis]|uniref:EF-P beta-lysylation protein EpmB n=1 Tax=Sodalis-like secondary symbiont of Drepanosiphum platanoidis TaxID=2994493 RepID=UPI003464C72B